MNDSDLLPYQSHPLAALLEGLRQAPTQILLVTALAHVALLAFAPPPAPREVAMEGRFVELLARVEQIDVPADRFVVATVEPTPLPIEPEANDEPVVEPEQAAEAEPLEEPTTTLVERRERPVEPPSDNAPQLAAATPPPETTVAPVVTSDAGAVSPMGEATTQRAPQNAPVVVAGVEPGTGTRETVTEPAPRGEPAVAPTGPAAVDGDLLARYSTRASQRLAGALRYTTEMREAGVTGSVVLAVVINEDGDIVEVRVERSSGSDLIDQAAVRDVERLRRLPAPPRGSGIAGRTLLLPANYAIPS